MSLIEPRPISELPSAERITINSPFHIALVVDGVVQAVFHTEERVASALLDSSHVIVQCEHPDNGGPEFGWIYDEATNTFSSR